MENEQKDSVESPVSRRAVLQFMAVGILTIATGLHIAYRRWKPKNKLGVTEITIEGPFERTGYFLPKDFGQKYTSKIASDFKIYKLVLEKGKRNNSAVVVFTFTGKEDSDRKMKIRLSIYGRDEELIGESENIFEDPRITAKKIKESGFLKDIIFPESQASLSVRLANGKDFSHVSRIEIFAIEVKNS